MELKRYDVAVIGGGIVGLATAMALTARARLSLIVLEAEARLAAHQSGHNSGVIHSGLYYKPGSLKARHCTEGREAMYRFCREHGIAHEQCGKLVVAVNETERAVLDELARRGAANGLQGIRQLTAEQLAEYEPHVSGIAGLFVPQTGIVNYADVAEAMARRAQEAGAEIRTQARVVSVQRRTEALILNTTTGDVQCRYLIGCAGLQSDRVARMCGMHPRLRIIPFRGEYYELIPERRRLVKNLIYPVPDPRLPFLGVHFTRTIDGRVEVGPNAVLAFKREGYQRTSFSLRDTLSMISYGGFWRMARRYGSVGLGEYYRSLSRRAFVRALQRLVPTLQPDDIQPAGAGVRAQAVDPTGQLIDDFRIIEAEHMIHVVNAPSPAATASLSIGQTIATMAIKRFALPTWRGGEARTGYG
ncbi:MAG: L-2-hydroxyglutarate oxidase [Acidobacteriota bacterium]|nr:L-2-hydroxyglutarate oxidase [Blastocatellia bacterium]MDW8240334.1 L-2-hydroxyglutarate oxidase [Acidobacteriota bacterium]